MVPDGVRAARSVRAPREVARRAPKTSKNARRRNGKRRFGSSRRKTSLFLRFFGFFAFRECFFLTGPRRWSPNVALRGEHGRHRARRVAPFGRSDPPRRRFSRFTTAAIAAKAPGPAPFLPAPVGRTREPQGHPWRKITDEHVSVLRVDGREVLKVEPEALRLVAQEG